MNRGLVGLRRGKRALNWPVVLWLGLLSALVSGCSAAAMWFLLTKESSLAATVAPMPFCVGLYLGTGLRKAFLVPPHQLPSLD